MANIRSSAATAVLALALPLSLSLAGTAQAASSPSTVPSSVTASAAASTAPVFRAVLPRPTGRYEAGVDIMHVVDWNRPDPWVPSAGPRQLMVSMFYPAQPRTGEPAPYMTLGEAAAFIQTRVPPGSGIQPQQLAGARTYAFSGARAVHGRFPLVVLSPGFENPRNVMTSLATDLASHGYVVALVDHTYEDSGTTFPDGQTLTCAICDSGPLPGQESVPDSRARDVSFVLDQLTGRHPAWARAGMIDPERIGMAGHSIGGASVVSTMAADPRVRAGVNLDGTFLAPVPAGGLGGRPFLMLGTQIDHNVGGSDPTWGQAWAALNGPKLWLTVAGTVHTSFTDIPILASEANIPIPGAQISSTRAMQITREYVDAFFDQTLKGVPQRLLEGPSATNPEVSFQGLEP
ncbi:MULTISPECIES: acetylhydrolase [Streptacidiphilus]|uniref:Alpha/beta hydrolase n=1 Tax=Streptacidiphilus cavernicola TaxID=3342716 RepID=A0ABV6UVT3_9ACTN|nr:acetylhydrolase [Streptacidiphilus jeojiense]